MTSDTDIGASGAHIVDAQENYKAESQQQSWIGAASALNVLMQCDFSRAVADALPHSECAPFASRKKICSYAADDFLSREASVVDKSQLIQDYRNQVSSPDFPFLKTRADLESLLNEPEYASRLNAEQRRELAENAKFFGDDRGISHLDYNSVASELNTDDIAKLLGHFGVSNELFGCTNGYGCDMFHSHQCLPNVNSYCCSTGGPFGCG